MTSEDTKQTIKLQTTQAYYEILRCCDMMNVREEEANALQEHMNKSIIRYREGVSQGRTRAVIGKNFKLAIEYL